MLIIAHIIMKNQIYKLSNRYFIVHKFKKSLSKLNSSLNSDVNKNDLL